MKGYTVTGNARQVTVLATLVSAYHSLILIGALVLTTLLITPQAIQACAQPLRQLENQVGQPNSN